jgi:hypothetical protein
MTTQSLSTKAPPVPQAPVRKWTAGPVMALLVIAGLVAAAIIVSLQSAAAPFTTHVIPSAVRDAIPGQRIVFLTTLTDDGNVTGEATVSARALEFADGVTITIAPDRIAAGEIAEVTVIIDENVVANLPDDMEPNLGQAAPDRDDPADEPTFDPLNPPLGPQGPEGVSVPIEVTLTRDGTAATREVTINVSRGEDTILDAATPLRDRFVEWLASERPELGITADTEWTPTIVQPHILVVSHYLFFSEEWEMGLQWHIMIAPHDWAHIYLRPRGELQPTHAFEIPSVSDATSVPREMEVPVKADR